MKNNPKTTSQPEAEAGAIVTHGGVFHADDVFATAVMTVFGYKPEAVTRTRDPKIISTAQIAVDVGGEHDPLRRRFDHHQRGGAGARPNGIPYAAFGLVWAAYGLLAVERIIILLMGTGRLKRVPFSGAICCGVHRRVDARLVQAVDAVDTGFASPGGFSVSSVISGFNAGWLIPLKGDEQNDVRFAEACDFAVVILANVVAEAFEEEVAAERVQEAVARREDPRVLVLDSFLPWQETVASIPEILLVVFPSEDNQWRIQVAPTEPRSFDSRIKLPEAWGGLRAEDLAKTTGVADAVFCHPGRFIAGAESREGVMALARLALE